MANQEQIDKLTNAIGALDNQISQVQAALNSPSTTGDQVLALRSSLIQLQAQRSALMSALIDLQASATEVDALDVPAAAPEVQAIHNELKASITNSTIADATLQQAAAVKGNVTLLQSMITKPKAKAPGENKH